MSKSISIIGCGWLGLPLAKHLVDDGWAVNGTTTTPSKLADIANIGAQPLLLHIGSETEYNSIASVFECDVLLIAIPPKATSTGMGSHPAQIKWLLEQTNPHRTKVIYISSTSVYPEITGTFDEHFGLSEQNTGNIGLWQAESHVLEHNNTNIVLRCSGLMGYNRVAGRYFAGKSAPGRVQPVNYVHRDDVIGITSQLLVSPNASGVFNAVCPLHPTRVEVYQYNSRKHGFEMPSWESDGINRIISSVRIQELPYSFQFPDPRNFP